MVAQVVVIEQTSVKTFGFLVGLSSQKVDLLVKSGLGDVKVELLGDLVKEEPSEKFILILLD